MARIRRAPTLTAPGSGSRSRSPKGISEDVLFRLVNLRSFGKRGYLDPEDGTIYSERRVNTTRAGGLSKETRTFLRRARAKRTPTGTGLDEDFERLLTDYQTAELVRTGTRPTRRALRKRGSAFFALLEDLQSGDRAPGGRMARALERLGYRDLGADYPVGESPPAQQEEFRDGPLWTPQYRPELPRRRRGRPVKARDRTADTRRAKRER